MKMKFINKLFKKWKKHGFTELKDEQTYNTIEKILNKYVMYLRRVNGDEKVYFDDSNQINEVQKIGIEAIKGMLDNKYRVSLRVDDNKVVSNCELYKQKGDYSENINYDLKINNMLIKGINVEITLILVQAELNGKDFTTLIKLDGTSYTYSVFLKDFLDMYNYSENMNVKDINIDAEYIKENKYNTFDYVRKK